MHAGSVADRSRHRVQRDCITGWSTSYILGGLAKLMSFELQFEAVM